MGTIQVGDEIFLQHQSTGKFLCSLPEMYSHEKSSHQQVVGAIINQDDRTVWTVKVPFVKPNSPAIPNPNLIRLEHKKTSAYLHSHGGRPSPVERQQEITAYPINKSDSNDNWVLETTGTWTEGVQFKLIHLETRAALHSHDRHFKTAPLSELLQEVTGFPYPRHDDNDFWVAKKVSSKIIGAEPHAAATAALDTRVVKEHVARDARLSMNNAELKELTEKLEVEFFLIKKHQFWYFVGGIVGVLALAGFVSYQGAMEAVKSFGGEAAIARIKDQQGKAESLVTQITALFSKTTDIVGQHEKKTRPLTLDKLYFSEIAPSDGIVTIYCRPTGGAQTTIEAEFFEQKAAGDDWAAVLRSKGEHALLNFPVNKGQRWRVRVPDNGERIGFFTPL